MGDIGTALLLPPPWHSERTTPPCLPLSYGGKGQLARGHGCPRPRCALPCPGSLCCSSQVKPPPAAPRPWAGCLGPERTGQPLGSSARDVKEAQEQPAGGGGRAEPVGREARERQGPQCCPQSPRALVLLCPLQ